MKRRTSAPSRLAENWTNHFVRTLGLREPPIDLFKIARSRRILRLGLRSIVPKGLLIPAEEGFEVYLQHDRSVDLCLEQGEPRGLLSPRKRFTLAHEIAHTFFYDIDHGTPRQLASAPSGNDLEVFCNCAAARILVPTELLNAAHQKAVEIDIAFVQQTAIDFRVSFAVAVDRISQAIGPHPMTRCILLGRMAGSDAEIRALCFGTGLLRTLTRPTPFTSLGDWLISNGLPTSLLTDIANCRPLASSVHRAVEFRKTAVGYDSFLLQADATPIRQMPNRTGESLR
jgi:hypothetical protein